MGGGGQEEEERESRKDDAVERTGVKGKQGERTDSGQEGPVAGTQQ